jgi:hypothetical protein
MLRAYVDINQDDWDKYLVTAEIAVNNSIQASSGQTPFYLNYGQHPNLALSGATKIKSKNQSVADLLTELELCLNNAKTSLQQAQNRQTQYANMSRRDVTFAEGDQVMVSTANLKKWDRAPKLLPKYIGPYKITKVVSPVAYELELPSNMRIHNTFHISKLKPYQSSDSGQFPNRTQTVRPAPDVIDDNEEWEVDRIIGKRTRKSGKRRQTEYQVLWKGFPLWESTWEPLSHLKHAKTAITEYESSTL